MSIASQELPPDDNRGPALNAVAWTFAALAAVFVAARLYTRARLVKALCVDDALIVFSLALFVTEIALNTVSVAYGVGRHVQYLSNVQISKALYLSAISAPLGTFTFFIPKAAVAVALAKVMGPQRHGASVLITVLVVLLLSSASVAILLFARCSPPSYYWNREQDGTCISERYLQDLTLFTAAWSAFVDLVLALFPISVLWKLQMEIKRKIAIASLMGLGVIAMAAAIAKVVEMVRSPGSDFTYNSFNTIILTYVELALLIICASAPTLPILVHRLRGKEKSRNHQTPFDVRYREKPASSKEMALEAEAARHREGTSDNSQKEKDLDANEMDMRLPTKCASSQTMRTCDIVAQRESLDVRDDSNAKVTKEGFDSKP